MFSIDRQQGGNPWQESLVLAAKNLEIFIHPINAAILTTTCPTELLLVCLSLNWYKHKS